MQKHPPFNIRKPGYVYVMRYNQFYKIGCSVHPEQRRTQVHNYLCLRKTDEFISIGTPDIVRLYEVQHMLDSERYLQNVFHSKRLERYEWFLLEPQDLDTIDSLMFLRKALTTGS